MKIEVSDVCDYVQECIDEYGERVQDPQFWEAQYQMLDVYYNTERKEYRTSLDQLRYNLEHDEVDEILYGEIPIRAARIAELTMKKAIAYHHVMNPPKIESDAECGIQKGRYVEV